LEGRSLVSVLRRLLVPPLRWRILYSQTGTIVAT
jgi:hypothetical protein